MDRHKNSDYGRSNDSRNERIDAEAAVAKHFEESLRRVHLLQSANPDVLRNFPRHPLNSANNSVSINPVISPISQVPQMPQIRSVLVRNQNELLLPTSDRNIAEGFKPYQGYAYPSYSQGSPHAKPIKVLPAPPKLISANSQSSQVVAPSTQNAPPPNSSVIVNMSKSPYSNHPNTSKQAFNKQMSEAEYYKKKTSTLIKTNTLPPLHHHSVNSVPIPYSPHRQNPPMTSKTSQPNISINYNAPNVTVSQIKPKISSPAPSRIYGQPNNPSISINADLPIKLVMKSKKPTQMTIEPQINYQKSNAPMAASKNIPPPPAHQTKLSYVPSSSLVDKSLATISSFQESNQLHPLNLGMPERKRLGSETSLPILDYNTKKNKIDNSESSDRNTAISLVKERSQPPGERNVSQSFVISKSPPTVVSLKTISEPLPTFETIVPNTLSWNDENNHPINFFGLTSQNVEMDRSIPSTTSKLITTNSSSTTSATGDLPPRNLKKAWLQRHTGKNYESTSGGGESNSSCAFTSQQSTSKQPSISGYSSETNRSNDSNATNKTKRKSKKTNSTHLSGKDYESSSDKDTNTDSTSGCDKKIGNKYGKNSGNILKKIKRRRKIKRSTIAQHRRTKSERDAIKMLKTSGDSFLQGGSCYEVAGKLGKCRECRNMHYKQRLNVLKTNVFCRFFAFRRLKYKCNAQLSTAGFSHAIHDASADDINVWMPNYSTVPKELNLQNSLFILSRVGDEFCNLWQQECLSLKEHMNNDKTIAWKKVVRGVRELCDVCETTLFNFHWTCGKCGFVVCVDCYKDRKNNKKKEWSESQRNRDAFSWLLCTTKFPHDQQKLILTQIIAGDSLEILAKRIHEIRKLWKIPQKCNCDLSNSVNVSEEESKYREKIDQIINDELLRQNSELSELNDDSIINCSDIEDFLKATTISNDNNTNDELNKESISTVETKKEIDEEQQKCLNELKKHLANENRFCETENVQKPSPLPVMTCTYSKLMYNKVPHSWLCGGRLLRLHDPKHIGNLHIFKDQWKHGQPVVVSGVSKLLNSSIWTPESFCEDFGDKRNDLVNCMNGNKVPNQPMKCFWEGFQYINKRLSDRNGTKMLLKLKDWPPAEDFAQSLPTRYNDLMQALPLNQYTQRSGGLNIAGRVPDIFVRPDLGPKMYSAYGSAFYPDKGTTNLHLDISDAVNVMIYVGLPKDVETDEHVREAFRAIDEAGCDILMRRRIRENNELPGAIWHIYSAEDTSKIRDLLNRVTIENGNEIEADSDPIHDQNFYLDKTLRERLYTDYGVQGYSIAQCLGDAVFIPAGSPHQVRNLHNCIKVAQDFVSPENVTECFRLTQEFRALSDAHSNHEDKLQIKNIIYHAVKDATAYLTHILLDKDIKNNENQSMEELEDNKNNLTDAINISNNAANKSENEPNLSQLDQKPANGFIIDPQELKIDETQPTNDVCSEETKTFEIAINNSDDKMSSDIVKVEISPSIVVKSE